MIIHKTIKYLLIDYCLNRFFKNIEKNILFKNQLINILPNVGDYYSEIIVETNAYKESYRNCLIKKAIKSSFLEMGEIVFTFNNIGLKAGAFINYSPNYKYNKIRNVIFIK